MQSPVLDDTIVAVSTGWSAAAVGVVRLSGPQSFALLERLGAAPPAGAPRWTSARLRWDDSTALPATVLWFRSPHSYTGQDVVEIHTVGCLPLLRELSVRLLAWGARRALPGEFTARAFVAGRLDSAQVEGVLQLMQSEHETGVRQAARLAGHTVRAVLAELRTRLTTLLALVEAGIDFVEEEDVRFVTPAAARAQLDDMIVDIERSGLLHADSRRAGKYHVALVGLPNAGKSTLFNALLGQERAIVSPVLGTTRDVLSAEVEFDGIAVVLQDCAGLGDNPNELEAATHVASERAAQQADAVLWVQAVDVPWSARAAAVCQSIPPSQRLLAWSKGDLPTRVPPPTDVTFAEAVVVSAATGAGLSELRGRLLTRLTAQGRVGQDVSAAASLPNVLAALQRARGTLSGTREELAAPELLSLELRQALGYIDDDLQRPLDERLLDRVFHEFCVGK